MAMLSTRLSTRAAALGRVLSLFVVLVPASLAQAPGPVWSTLLGGSGKDTAYAVAVDAAGLVTIAGRTESLNWPFGPPAVGGSDAFVARLDPRKTGAAQLLWCTPIGGSGADLIFDLVMSEDGKLISVAGLTTSANLSCTPTAYQASLRGVADAFVAQLDGMTGGVKYLTYLGGYGHDWANAIECDASGRLVLAGVTDSPTFPVTPGVVGPFHRGATDMFVTVFDPRLPGAAQIVASTYLGGSLNEGVPFNLTAVINMSIGDVAVSADSTIVVVGRTTSLDFPTTPQCFQPLHAGGLYADMFVTRLSASLTSRMYSTYLGGSDDDGAMQVVVDSSTQVYVAGLTWSPGTSFPTTAGAVQRSLSGLNDGVITVLDTGVQGTAALRYSTLLGGTGTDYLATLLIEDSGVITAAGASGGGFVGTPGAWRPNPSGPDAVLLRLDPRGQGAGDLHYLSFLGGAGGGSEVAVALARHGDGLVTVAGYTDSPFPTTPAALQATPGGMLDAFVCTFDMLPRHALRVGMSTPGCRGPVWMQPNSNPAAGNSTFTLLGNGAPFAAAGVHVFGLTAPATPIRVFNVDLYVGPQWVTVPATADARGAWRLTLPPLPAWLPVPPPATVYLQSIWLESASCALGPLSASHALGL